MGKVLFLGFWDFGFLGFWVFGYFVFFKLVIYHNYYKYMGIINIIYILN